MTKNRVMKNMLLDNDREPSDEELAALMSEVAEIAKIKNVATKLEMENKIEVGIKKADLEFKLALK
jgi:hypothetical protein